MQEPTLPDLIALTRKLLGDKRCFCPTKSEKLVGLILSANGLYLVKLFSNKLLQIK